jgi:hypothetical protein
MSSDRIAWTHHRRIMSDQTHVIVEIGTYPGGPRCQAPVPRELGVEFYLRETPGGKPPLSYRTRLVISAGRDEQKFIRLQAELNRLSTD